MQQLLRRRNDLSGTGSEELFTVTEAPIDTDAGKTGIACSFRIDIGIPDIDGVFLFRTELCKDLENGIGSRFSWNACDLTTGKIEQLGKILLHKGLDCEIRLIGKDGSQHALFTQGKEQLRYAVIGTGSDRTVLFIIRCKNAVYTVNFRFRRTGRESTFDQLADAVADKAADFLDRADGVSACGEGEIGPVREIFQCIKNCTVKVEDGEFVFHEILLI